MEKHPLDKGIRVLFVFYGVFDMANEENLRPCEYKFTDEDREKARRVRQENLKRKKSLKETLDILLEYRPTEKELDFLREHGIDVEDDATYRTAVAFSMINKAVKGNTRAFEMLRDTIGEKPVDKIQIAEVDEDTVAEVEAMVMADDDETTGN